VISLPPPQPQSTESRIRTCPEPLAEKASRGSQTTPRPWLHRRRRNPSGHWQIRRLSTGKPWIEAQGEVPTKEAEGVERPS
jgi:hypothetical protein